MKDYGLSVSQNNVLSMQRFYPDTAIGNLCSSVCYHETRSLDLLEKAIIQTIMANDAMRLRMTSGDRQYVSDESPSFIERRQFADANELEAFAKDFAGRPFTAPDSGQFAFCLFEMQGRQGIVASLSHMISDAMGLAIIFNHVENCYAALVDNPDFNAATAGSYLKNLEAESEYMKSAQFEKDKSFWEDSYISAPCSSSINALTAASPDAVRVSYVMSERAEAALDTVCENWNRTPAAVFETLMLVYLYRLHPDDADVTISIPVHNRTGSIEKSTAGMRVLTLPVTLSSEHGRSVADWARRESIRKTAVMRHRKYPLILIQEHLRRLGMNNRLYHVMVNYHAEFIPEIIDLNVYSPGANESALCLHIDDRFRKHRHTLTFDYQTEAFTGEEEVLLLKERIEHMLIQCAETPDISAEEIDILSPSEPALLDSFNDTSDEVPDMSVHEYFIRTARNNPDKTAVIFHDEEITYRELDSRSSALASYIASETPSGSIVAIISKRSPDMIAAMIAVLKAGSAFMFISPDAPPLRIKHMLEISGCSMALTDGFEGELDVPSADLKNPGLYQSDAFSAAEAGPDDRCYIVFTSGSTGEPKGISISHGNLMNYIAYGENRIYGRCIPRDTNNILCLSASFFDIFLTETILPLIHGMTVVMADDDESIMPGRTAELMKKTGVEVLQTTPTKLKLLTSIPGIADSFASLKAIMIGGEAFPTASLKMLKELADAEIFNVYGPSESTVWCSADSVHQEPATIGLPFACTAIRLLDGKGRSLPIGAEGEMYISGVTLSEGYIGRPDLTDEQFVTLESGERSYRTGDMAYRLPDGRLVFTGRRDSQVKIRGQRIELGEIETAVTDLSDAKLAAALVPEHEGRQILFCYYSSDRDVDEDLLVKRLKTRLPGYMIPQFFERLPEMPMTPTGKLDRKRLPVPNIENKSHKLSDFKSDTERKLAGLWESELHIERVGPEDDYFLLGGDSLAAISLAVRAEDVFGISINVGAMYEHPILRDFAGWIDAQPKSSEKAGLAPDEEISRYRLMPQQMPHYRFCMENPDSLTFQLGFRMDLPDDVDRKKLEDAIVRVVKNEKGLCCRIEEAEDGVYMVFDPECEINFEDFADENEFRTPIDLGKAPLVHLGRMPGSLLIDVHHIVSDGDSMELLFDRIEKAYTGGDANPGKYWYGDYVRAFESKDFTDAYKFFDEQLSGTYPSIKLPESDTGLTGGESLFYQIPDDLFSRIKDFTKIKKISLTALTLAAYGLTMSATVKRPDIFVMVNLRNRMRPEYADIVGMFTNSQPVHLSVTGDLRGYLDAVSRNLMEQYKYQELPMDTIRERIDLSGLPQIDTAFLCYPDAGDVREIKIPVPEILDSGDSIMHLTLKVHPEGNHCRISIEYKRNLYGKSFIDEFAGLYLDNLERLIQASSDSPSDSASKSVSASASSSEAAPSSES